MASDDTQDAGAVMDFDWSARAGDEEEGIDLSWCTPARSSGCPHPRRIFGMERSILTFGEPRPLVLSPPVIEIRHRKTGKVLQRVDAEELAACDLKGADLRGADLRDAHLTRANLEGADLRGALLTDADLVGANLRGVQFQNADLEGAELGNADLREANLSGSVLRYARMSAADLRGANLRGANLRKATMRHIRYNEQTRWPWFFDVDAAICR